jgi:hypothetical protein
MRNPENTLGASSRPPLAAAPPSRRWRRPQHSAAARRSSSQQSLARQCAAWTCGAGWARVTPQRFPGVECLGAAGPEKLERTHRSRVSQASQEWSRDLFPLWKFSYVWFKEWSCTKGNEAIHQPRYLSRHMPQYVWHMFQNRPTEWRESQYL